MFSNENGDSLHVNIIDEDNLVYWGFLLLTNDGLKYTFKFPTWIEESSEAFMKLLLKAFHDNRLYRSIDQTVVPSVDFERLSGIPWCYSYKEIINTLTRCVDFEDDEFEDWIDQEYFHRNKVNGINHLSSLLEYMLFD